MADTPIRAQAVGTGAQTDVYTVPTGFKAVISTIHMSNNDSVSQTVRVSIAPAGAVDAVVHRLVPTRTLAPGTLLALTEGIALRAGDVVRFLGASGNCVIHLYGMERTA